MKFTDEFEHEFLGNTYYISVNGAMEDDEFVLETINVTDELGNVITEADDVYEECLLAANTREYEVEVHERNFDYCEEDVNNFLKEKTSF